MSPYRASAPLTESWGHFQFDVTDGIGTLVLSRPDQLNALTFDVYADLRDLLVELPHRGDVGVLVVTGSGRGFCSGGDVNEIIGSLQTMDSKGLLEFTRMTGSVVQRMRELPIPIIAAVNGVAAGAGAVIALAADLRVMSATAAFHFLFTRVGLAGADMGAAYLLPRVVGLGRATELLLLGEAVPADEAQRIGLVNRVVEDEALMDEVAVLARKLATGPTWAIGSTKSLLARELDMDLAASIELEAWTQALLMTGEDHHRFYEAFRTGQRPQWTGR